MTRPQWYRGTGLAREGLPSLLGLVVALGLLVNAAVALWIGVQDTLWPVSLSAQLVGLFYFIAGILSLAGVFGVFSLFRKARGPTGKANAGQGSPRLMIIRREAYHRPLTLVASAAVAGLYIDLNIVFLSLHYQTKYVWAFGVLSLLCACLACVALPVIWNDLSKSLKAAGISLAVLGAAAQFWYNSVYVPANTAVGMEYAFSIGPAARSGADRLVQVNLTWQDAGTVPVLGLNSMVVVSGIGYPSGRSTILRVLQPIAGDSFIFPNDKYSRAFVVVISKPWVDALDVKLVVNFARATWLMLGQKLPTREYHFPSCPQGWRSEWYIHESALRRFTEGTQVLYSDWCYSRVDPIPHIDAGIAGLRSGRLVFNPYQSPSGSDLGILHSFRDETLLLG